MEGTPGDIGRETAPQPSWRIPAWYRRVGLISWFFLGISAAIALIAVLFAATSEITIPLVLGAFLAIVCWPVVNWLDDRGLPRAVASLIALLGLAALVVGASWLAGIALVDQADELTASLNQAVDDIKTWLSNTPVNEQLADQVRTTAGDVGPSLTGGLADRAFELLDSAFGLITGTVLGVIVFYYLAKDGPALFDRWLEREEDPDTRALLRRIGEQVISNTQNYFRGRTAMAFVNGAGIGVAAAILGVPAAMAIAIVNFVGAYIPYLGAFIGGAFAVLMALGDGGLGSALIVLAIVLAVNLLLENLLEPVLLGDSLDLHPLLILLATTLGGIIAGMIGLILAAPALAILLDTKRELAAAGFFDES